MKSMADPLSFPSAEPEATAPDSSADTVAPAQLPGATRFKTCRWRRPPDEGVECCGHRDVLPMAGTTGFDPEAWCPDCSFYKLRRTPKKRDPDEYRY